MQMRAAEKFSLSLSLSDAISVRRHTRTYAYVAAYHLEGKLRGLLLRIIVCASESHPRGGSQR
jgi:hypothetical protein